MTRIIPENFVICPNNDNYCINRDGDVFSFYLKRNIAKNILGKWGHLMVHLWKNNKHNCITNHKLVALSFPTEIENHELHEQFPNIYKEIDHKDRNPKNNNVSNLRWIDSGQNKQNKARVKGKAEKQSQYKGVYWDKSRNKWQAEIQYNGKKEHLGRFEDEDDAGRAYDERAKELYKGRGKIFLNFPDVG